MAGRAASSRCPTLSCSVFSHAARTSSRTSRPPIVVYQVDGAALACHVPLATWSLSAISNDENGCRHMCLFIRICVVDAWIMRGFHSVMRRIAPHLNSADTPPAVTDLRTCGKCKLLRCRLFLRLFYRTESDALLRDGNHALFALSWPLQHHIQHDGPLLQ